MRSFGVALLSALEKNDAEVLSLKRATQETSLLTAMQKMKQSAVDEANAALAGLKASLTATQARFIYYTTLILAGNSPYELQQLTNLSDAVTSIQSSINNLSQAASKVLIPEFGVGFAGFGGSPSVSASFGGGNFVSQSNLSASQDQANATEASYNANQASLNGQWDRRGQDWAFQLHTATDEINEINAQIGAAQYRVYIAQDDQSNLYLQIQNAQAVEDFLTGKYTNAQLYSWMADQISSVYLQCYQMAYDLAHAPRRLSLRAGPDDSSYIQFGYWDSLKKGLLSGERLVCRTQAHGDRLS